MGAQWGEGPAAIGLLINCGHSLQPCATGTKERIKGFIEVREVKRDKSRSAILLKSHLMDWGGQSGAQRSAIGVRAIRNVWLHLTGGAEAEALGMSRVEDK